MAPHVRSHQEITSSFLDLWKYSLVSYTVSNVNDIIMIILSGIMIIATILIALVRIFFLKTQGKLKSGVGTSSTNSKVLKLFWL